MEWRITTGAMSVVREKGVAEKLFKMTSFLAFQFALHNLKVYSFLAFGRIVFRHFGLSTRIVIDRKLKMERKGA